MKSILSSFAEWLIDEELLTRNPTRGIEFPAQQLLSPHDLRHDFGHRLRAAGFSLEEVAVTLGHVTKKGTPAVATTARYTQPSRAQMKRKLRDIAL